MEIKKLYIKKFIEISIFVFFFVLFQIIQFSRMYTYPFPSYWFLDYFLLLILASIIFIVKNTLFDQIYLSLLMLVIGVFCVANVTYFSNFGDVFSLFNLTMIGQGAQLAMNPSFFDFGFIAFIIFIYAFYVICLILFNKLFKIDNMQSLYKTNPLRKEKKHAEIKRRYCCLFSSMILLIGAFSVSENTLSDNNEIITMQKSANFRKYGTLTYYLKEINYVLNGSNTIDSADMKNYFTQYIDASSDYSGILKGKNVVIIMIETGDSLMLNSALTPNIASLSDKAIYCENNHSKNKTNISEFIGITGSAPSMGIQADKYEYYLPYSLPNMLGDDYKTMYFHDVGKDDFQDRDIYSRHILMPKLNFDESYFHEDIYSPDTPIWGWNGDYSLDSDTLDIVGDILVEQEEPFMAFYTSLSMHGPYVNPINESLLKSLYGEKLETAKEMGEYINPLADTINEQCIDNYMMAAMDFDKALGDLFAKFEAAGKLDDTLFVLYGDHDIYYPGADDIGLNLTLAGVDNIVYCPFDTTLFFYNPKLTEEYVKRNDTNRYSQFTSPYNIVPTILDLLGVEYNPNFYIGNSLFSEMMQQQQVFYSSELSSIFNDYYYSVDGSIINYVFDENAHCEEEFIVAAAQVLEKQNYLEKILTSDYFSDHNFSIYQPIKPRHN